MTDRLRHSTISSAVADDRRPCDRRIVLRVFVCTTALACSMAAAQSNVAQVRLELVTGGRIEGGVVDHNEHAVVVVADRTPFVLAWTDVKPMSSVAAKFAIIEAARGGRDAVTAEDYYGLGLYALSRKRYTRASALFRAAKRLDPSMAEDVRKTMAASRKSRSSDTPPRKPAEPFGDLSEIDPKDAKGLIGQIENALHKPKATNDIVSPTPESTRTIVMDIYRAFGRKAQEVLGKRVAAIESEHFLIWTDWSKADRTRLVAQCEAMYAAMCRQFGISDTTPVFLAKCPVFCFESKARFLKFARMFDGYDGHEAIGYTRSIERNGHVHMVLYRRGRTEEDFDRFACTLVHEGTHAFVHRLYTPRLIPNWINEGLAELMTERVLENRCPTAETAQLLAVQYVEYDWPVANLIRSAGPIDVHHYPIAHSLIAYLASRGDDHLRGFVKRLKEGDLPATALAGQYDGMTLDGLEQGWRAWIGEGINRDR